MNKTDLMECGMKEISLLDLAETGKLDRIVVSKIGKYYGQNLSTILETKLYDIQHNKLKDKGHLDIIARDEKDTFKEGICSWAISNSGPNEKRGSKFLSENEEYKDERYVIFPYTSSLLYAKTSSKKDTDRLQRIAGESIEEYFVRMKKFYESGENEKINFIKDFCFNGKKVDYPSTAFPAVVKAKRGKAFLISEFSFCRETFTANDFYEFYNSCTFPSQSKTEVKDMKKTFIHVDKDTGEPHATSCSHVCGKIKDRVALVDWLSKLPVDRASTEYVIAKLEYPYIVAFNV